MKQSKRKLISFCESTLFMFTDKIYGKWMAATQKEKLEKILIEIGIKNLEGKRILDVGSGAGFL
ncbi:MAG: hypothetical protein KKB25_01035, partial [Nanoarchaeota archaeon]|nr:hypothetical protein [Nanoarchaeota archaeon]